MKILHLSDFHIVSDSTFEYVHKLNENLAKSDILLPIGRSELEDRQSLLKFLSKGDGQAKSYDGIIFTGDATSFGDASSMEMAIEFLEEIMNIALKPECENNVRSIPGNHDVLEYGLRTLFQDLNGLLGPVGNLLSRFANAEVKNVRTSVEAFLKSLAPGGASPLASEQIANFRHYAGFRFSSMPGYPFRVASDKIEPLNIRGKTTSDDDIELNFVPINTLPSAPALVNMGVVSAEMLENVRYASQHLVKPDDETPVLNFALTHHGLMALTQQPVIRTDSSKTNLTAILEHSLSAQLNGFLLGRALQEAGFDAHFHGHEHQSTSIRFDFDVGNLGSIYSIGVGSVAAEPAHQMAFNVLEFPNEFCMTMTSLSYDTGGGFVSKKTNHVFDKISKGAATRLARDEICRFFISEGDLDLASNPNPRIDEHSFVNACDEMLLESPLCVFVFGVRLDKLRVALKVLARDGDDRERSNLRDRLEKTGLKILVVAPRPDGSGPYDKKMAESYEELRDEWRDSLEQIVRDTGANLELVQQNLEIRFTRTPIAHAGHVELPENGAEARIRAFSRGLIQAIKVVDDYDTEVFLELKYRTSRGLLKYYAGSAWNLWRNSRERLDVWGEGEALEE